MSNSYGFLIHPYLTLKRVSGDRSQMAIFASLWLGAWLGIAIFGVFAFIIYRFFPELVLLKNFGMGLGIFGTVFLLIFTFYLVYWIVIFWQKK